MGTGAVVDWWCLQGEGGSSQEQIQKDLTWSDGIIPPQVLTLVLQGCDFQVPLRQGLAQHLAVALLQGTDLWEEAIHSQSGVSRLCRTHFSKAGQKESGWSWVGVLGKPSFSGITGGRDGRVPIPSVTTVSYIIKTQTLPLWSPRGSGALALDPFLWLRQEADGLQAGYLQPAFCLHFPRQEVGGLQVRHLQPAFCLHCEMETTTGTG